MKKSVEKRKNVYIFHALHNRSCLVNGACSPEEDVILASSYAFGSWYIFSHLQKKGLYA